jgi:hypothetical protein
MSSLHYLGTMTYRLVVSGKTQPGSFSDKDQAMTEAKKLILEGETCRIEAHYPSPEIPMMEYRWDHAGETWVKYTP